MFGEQISVQQLSNVIPDPNMLQTALKKLDANETGLISIQKLANFIQHFSSQNSMVSEDLGSLSRSSSTDENTFSGSDAVSYQEHWKTSDDDSKSSEVFQSLPQSTPARNRGDDDGKYRKKVRKSNIMRRVKEDVDSGSDAEEITDRMHQMQSRLHQLEDHNYMINNQLEQARADNFKLRNRNHELEECLRDTEVERDTLTQDAAKVSLEDYLKLEREKKLNEESLMNQVTQLQNDKDELKTEIFKIKHKVEKQKQELASATEKVDEYQQRAVIQIEKYQLLTEKTGNEREELQRQTKFQQEQVKQHQRVIDDLEQQNQILSERLEFHSRDQIDSIKTQTDIPSDLEAASLREENEKLTEVIEDLNLQLLNQHVSRARALSEQRELDASAGEDESKEKVEERYKKLQETHQDLRMYLERILDNIMERDPHLLEIQAK